MINEVLDKLERLGKIYESTERQIRRYDKRIAEERRERREYRLNKLEKRGYI